MIITVTDQQLWSMYAGWSAVSSGGLWLVAQWYAAQRRQTDAPLIAAAVISFACVASTVYAYSVFNSPPQSDFIPSVVRWGAFVSFVVWPFVTCAAVTQISIRSSPFHRGIRWLPLACGILISLACPFALLTTGCGFEHICM